jgi:hypothetical protein
VSRAIHDHIFITKNVLQFERKSSLQKWSQESQKKKILRTIENVKLQDPLSLHFRGRGDTQKKSKIHQFNRLKGRFFMTSRFPHPAFDILGFQEYCLKI